jgi:DNA-binding NarL/FixJ family response regulator
MINGWRDVFPGLVSYPRSGRVTIKILVADDSELIRSSLKAGFSGTDIQVVSEASTGDEAVTQTRIGRIDVVLLDIEMPRGNGFDALRQIKSENPEMPVIMHSTHDSPCIITRSSELGADGYVVKGTDLGGLIDMIRAVASPQYLPMLCAQP